MMKKMTGKWIWTLLLMSSILFFPAECLADLKTSDALVDSEWTLLTEYELSEGSLQSICCTDTYIVCLVNSSNTETTNDTLIAFYKGGSDADGNEVEPYSVAFTVTERDYEHGNGMTYNPDTNEIIIAGGRSIDESNRGCVFIVDGDTLTFKEKVQVSEDWNVQAIDYCEDSGSYILQKGSDGDFGFVETDLDFNITAELSDMVEMGFGGEANTFQDLCICGDDLISLPYNSDENYNGNLQVYSRSEGTLLGEYQLDLEAEASHIEAESISELYAGSFVLGCYLKSPKRIALYGAKLPMTYNMEASVENGSVTLSASTVDLGGDCEVTWEADEHYELSEIIIDGESVNLGEDVESYTFRSVTEDHSIEVIFTELPQFEITVTAENGTADGTRSVYRDDDVTIFFSPDEWYELDCVLVDGQKAEPDESGTSVTIGNVQEDHSIEVIFTEIPSFEVEAEAKNGSISTDSVLVYRDEDYTVTFEGRDDYELYRIYVDGVRLEELPEDGSYTFENVTESHTISVVFRWQYTDEVRAGAAAAAALLIFFLYRIYRRKKERRWKRIERNMWLDEMQELRGKEEKR